MNFNKSWALSLVLTALLCTTITYGLMQAYPYVHHDPRASVNVFVITETAAGRNELAGGNVITDIFETNLRNTYAFYNDTMVPNATNMTKYISTGNCTPAQTLTKITTESTNNGFARAVGTVAAWMNGTDAAFNVTKTFTAATAGTTINSAGLNWYAISDSDNNLVAVAAITETAFAIGDNCTIKGYD